MFRSLLLIVSCLATLTHSRPSDSSSVADCAGSDVSCLHQLQDEAQAADNLDLFSIIKMNRDGDNGEDDRFKRQQEGGDGECIPDRHRCGHARNKCCEGYSCQYVFRSFVCTS